MYLNFMEVIRLANLKAILSVVAACLATAGIAAWINMSDEEVSEAANKVLNSKSQVKDKLDGLSVLINTQKQDVIALIKDFYSNKPAVLDIGDIEYPKISFDNRCTVKLLESLSNFLSSLSDLKSCFQHYTTDFNKEYENLSSIGWNYWDNHLQLLYRDIAILTDFLLDICKPFTDQDMKVEYIEVQTAKMKCMIDQYSSVSKSK